MTKLNLLIAGLYATSALASPWSRYQKRGGGGGYGDHGGHNGHNGHGGGWGTKKTTATPELPTGYGGSASETSPWGYGSTTGCEASTVTETQGKKLRYESITMYLYLQSIY